MSDMDLDIWLDRFAARLIEIEGGNCTRAYAASYSMGKYKDDPEGAADHVVATPWLDGRSQISRH